MFADVEILKLVLGQYSTDEIGSNFVFELVNRISYFGKQNWTLGSVVPLEMFLDLCALLLIIIQLSSGWENMIRFKYWLESTRKYSFQELVHNFSWKRTDFK